MNQHDILGNLTDYQIDVLVSKAKIKVMLCGRQVGKSQTIRALVYKHAMENPNCEILVVAKTHKQVREIHWRHMVEAEDSLFVPQLVKKANNTRLTLELKNGSRIFFTGSENIDSVRGLTVDLAVLDEMQSHTKPDYVWSVIQPMLAMKDGDALICGTANGYDVLWDFAEKGTLGSNTYTNNFRTWKIPTPDCGLPSGKPQAIELAKSSMSTAQFNQEYLILPTALTGRVAPDYDIDLNESTMELDTKKPLLCSMDFNVGKMVATINQTVVKEQFHPNGRLKSRKEELHCIDELVMENTNTEKFAQTLSAKYAQWKGKMIMFPDASGNSRKTSSNTTDHQILKEHGFKIQTDKANPLQNDRINATNRLICDAKGERRYFVNRRCKEVIRALIGLTYDENGKMDKKNEANHAFDAATYIIAKLYPIKTNTFKQTPFNA